MPVMKNMRDIIKPVMWVVVIAFVGTIVLVWGGDITKSKYKKGIIGIVDGKEISEVDFRTIYNEQLGRVGKDYEELDDETATRVLDNTWDNMVNQILLSQQIKKLEIVVSDRELFEYMKRFPPAEFQQDSIFQTDGKFDYQKYAQALNNPRFPWGQVEGYVRSTLVTWKLQETITDLVRMTDQEVKQEYVNRNEKIRVNYLFMPSSRFVDKIPQVTPPEIQQYYEQNRDEFKLEQRANLAYVAIPKEPNQDDIEKIKSDLLRIKMEAEEGEDFKVLAQDYSDDKATSDSGGDLGWFARGKMIKTFEEAAFSLKVGEISGPVRTQYGWHLIKLLEKRKVGGSEELHASHILLKITISESTIDSLRTLSEDLTDQATKIGLEETAKKAGLNLLSSGFFSRTQIIPGLGWNHEVNQFAFQNKAGKVSDPIETRNNFLVISIKERRPAGVPPLNEVKQKIEGKMKFAKAGEFAFKEAEEIYQEATNTKNLGEAAAKFGQKVTTPDYFTRNSVLPEVNNDPLFIGTAFSLDEKNPISRPIKTDDGVRLIEFVSRIPASEVEFATTKDSLFQEILTEKKTQCYLDWFDEVRKKAKIEDYRSKFYRTGGL